ncbi:MAG TPA: fused MFS/spermidine synthase [Thermoanaerobaculia bacterium]|nr:fused MFS/spermidine synthase [Thermoanaerobaculia bacterium]
MSAGVSLRGSRRMLPWAAALVFASGLAAVTYQVAWLRLLRLFFGASTAANATVLAIFMGGLGLGGLYFARRVERAPNPLALYAWLEILIGLFAAASPLLIAAARASYLAVGGTAALGPLGGTFALLLLSLAVLGPPTLLMGGTLPAIARAVERAEDRGRRALGVVYGVNTLGAVTGAVWSTFLGIELLGIRNVLWLAALLNLLVGLVARSLARGAPESPTPEAAARGAEALARPAGTTPRATWVAVLSAAGVVGFVFFLMELVWYRMLGPLLGGSSYSFGLILAVALLGIGAGGLLYGAGARARRPRLVLLAATCALEALALAVPLALGDRLALLALALRGLGAAGFGGMVVGWTVVTAIVVLPAALVAGYQFPLLVGLVGAGRDRVAIQVGMTYAANTLGAIAGALLGGFVLIPMLGAVGAWRLAIVLLAALAAALLVVGRAREHAAAIGWSAASVAAAALLLLAADGPGGPWRHGGIGAGRMPAAFAHPNEMRAHFQGVDGDLIWERDGRESSVALVAGSGGYAFLVNGKSDGNARGDAPTQVMSGLVAGLLHPDPRLALVIGLGTGSSSGWLAAVPGVERVDTVELEPVIVDVARACEAVNHGALANPAVRLLFGDGREWLLTTDQRYDVIFSEPSNPYRAGVASLFSLEFYRAAAARMSPDGIFAQWLQGYDADIDVVRMAFATMAEAFAEVQAWQVSPGDLLLVASPQPITFDVAELRRRVAGEPYRTALSRVWGVHGVEGLLAGFLAGPELARWFHGQAAGALSTDDRPRIEFGFVRNLGRGGLFDPRQLWQAAVAGGWQRPAAAGVDWGAVDEAWSARQLAFGLPAGGREGDEAAALRARARDAWRGGEWRLGVELWRTQQEAPAHLADLTFFALALAQLGDEGTLETAARLAQLDPVAAAAIRGLWHARREEPGEAGAALAAAFVGFRADPWPVRRVFEEALRAAPPVAAADPAAGRELFRVLGAPFAVRLLDDERRVMRTEVAVAVAFEELCAEAFGALEPLPPWNGNLLARRLECYEAVGSPLAARARRDLGDFLEAAGPVLAPPPPASGR